MFYLSDGDQLFSMTSGAGPDVVLLHPTPLHHGFWMPIASNLVAKYRVTITDLRGHGRSELGQGSVTIARLGQDIERLLDAAAIESAVFIGCSIGGYLLYELWRRIPDRVRGLAVCCGKPQPDAAANRARRQEAIEAVRKEGAGAFFDQTLVALTGSTFRKNQPAGVAELRSMMDSMTPEGVIAIQRCLMERPDSVPTLSSISVPVLALAAAEDPASTPEEMKILAEKISAVEFHLLPDAGHYVPFEQPEVVGRILEQFLGRIPA